LQLSPPEEELEEELEELELLEEELEELELLEEELEELELLESPSQDPTRAHSLLLPGSAVVHHFAVYSTPLCCI
jgi:cell shape-determining protein MreC